MGQASNAKQERLPELDGLRALAIITVLLHHALSAFPASTVRRLAGFGWTGVDLFFVISGFFLGGILIDQRAADNYYRIFYLRRFLRIVPLYVLVITPALLITVLGLQSWFKGHSLGGKSSPIIWLYPFFLQNFGNAFMLSSPKYLGPSWSLAVEEQFYLLLAPLVRVFDPRRLPCLIIPVILAAPVLRGLLVLLLQADAKTACYQLLPCRWDALFLGVLAAYAVRNPSWREWQVRRLGFLRVLWLILAAGMLLLAISGWSQYDPKIAVPGYTWIAAFFTCSLLLAHLNPAGSLRHWLSRPVLRPVALVSYGLYLLQGPTVAVIESFFHPPSESPIGWKFMGVNCLALLLDITFATLSWRFFESRLIRLGHQHRFRGGRSEVYTPNAVITRSVTGLEKGAD